MTQTSPGASARRPWPALIAVLVILLLIPGTRHLMVYAFQLIVGGVLALLIGAFIFGVGRRR